MIDYHPDGDQIVVNNNQGSVMVLKQSTGEQLLKIPLLEEDEWSTGIAYSPDGALVATPHGNGVLQIWDGHTGELLSRLSDFGEDLLNYPYDIGLHDVDFSPLCHTLPGEICPVATAGVDGRVIIWDALTGRQILKYQNETALTGLAFSPDGKMLAFGDSQMISFDQGKVKLLDVESGEILRVWSGITGWIFGVEFSPDGKHIAIGTTYGDFRIMDAENEEPVLKLDSTSTSAIINLAYTPDGKYLLTNGFDATTVWDAKTGERLYVLAEGTSIPIGLAVSPDGSRVVIGTDKVCGYILDMEQLAALGQERLTRSFALDECQKYLHLEQCPED